ncbi:MAG: TonB-dependent receptor [Mesorhizobium sp.]|nr:TonB-dependent receptor [Mesorhizobium sp.]MBL8579587.1 TonB-dependent receptor [Mesorhizobium sp.]
MTILLGSQAGWAQQAQPTTAEATEEGQVVNQTDKKGRVTLLQRIVLGAGADKVAIDTPQAVTVLDQQAIDNAQAQTMGGLFKDVPGVTMAGSERVVGQAFNIRGIGQTDNSADGSRIIINVDGAPKFNEQYRMGSFFSEPELYRRVEVLRGPASSTLYGAGALGGVINFTTKDAAEFLQDGQNTAVRLKGGYDSNNNGALASTILAHRFNEGLEVLAAGNFRRSDNFELGNGTELSGSAFDSWSGLLKATAYIGDEGIARASYQRWQSNKDQTDYAQTGTQTNQFGYVDRDVTDQTFVLSYENPFTDNPWLDIDIALTYSDTENDQSNASNGFLTNPNDQSTLAILNDTLYAYKTWQLKGENTIDSTFENAENHFTFGFQASTQDRVAEKTGLPLTAHPEGTENKLGLFAQNEYIWNEQLTVIAGVRGDFHTVTPSSGIPNAEDIEDSAFSPKIAALYDFNDYFGVFGSVAYTERMPTIDELYSWAPPTPPGMFGPGNKGKTLSLDLQKEKSTNYEAGFTVSGADLLTSGDVLNVKTTGFYNDLTNLITSSANVLPSSPLPAPAYYYNIGKARIYGVEVEGAYDADYVFAGVAYTATWGQNRVEGANFNQPLATIPAQRVALTIGGRIPDYFLEFAARITVAADAKNGAQQAGSPTLTPPIYPVAGWETLDLYATWRPQDGNFAGYEVLAGIDNVFDEDYRDNLSPDIAKGRNFKISLSKQFGW